jgi:hypothetical protein
MTEVIDRTPAQPPADSSAQAAPDLAGAVQRVLAASDEPLTVSKLRARLPGSLRNMDPKELTDLLERQVAANVLYKYPKYRSQQDRYWDRGMSIHIAYLLGVVLDEGPLPWSELRRKLPAYAQAQAQPVLDEQVRQGLLHRHPRAGTRGSDRYGNRPPDPRDYLRLDLPELFTRLTALGFTRPQIRAAALELLHEEEWDTEPPAQAAESEAETHPETPDAGKLS